MYTRSFIYLSVLVFKRMLKDVAEDLYQHHCAVLDQLGVIVLVVQELRWKITSSDISSVHGRVKTSCILRYLGFKSRLPKNQQLIMEGVAQVAL